MSTLVITGTGTGVGKTVFAAGLAAALRASYWKPVQAGLEEATDTETVSALTNCRVLPERYRLRLPASPHLAAEDLGLTIDLDALSLPQTDGLLIVEGAGGVMVPLNRQSFYLDLFTRWQAPVILVALTALGTINHTALSLAALRRAGCPVLGVVFNGPPEPEVEQSIVDICDTRHLGRLDPLPELSRPALLEAFKAIDLDTIRKAP
ncbi:dethiobiotin synthase [Paracoccus methylarcula]|uniref:ATP-dependent dethiobiotin synthetase BioD n=1 Tax=Paracoccus methylarcula TaxID=72022 RepID=A0A3R7SDW0_9RHOB|nr:dethiobiotin synthase [Paracoccus methylarcula]RNF36018.1 dethiobiotin synthase [Paracoccus methylarcula]